MLTYIYDLQSLAEAWSLQVEFWIVVVIFVLVMHVLRDWQKCLIPAGIIWIAVNAVGSGQHVPLVKFWAH